MTQRVHTWGRSAPRIGLALGAALLLPNAAGADNADAGSVEPQPATETPAERSFFAQALDNSFYKVHFDMRARVETADFDEQFEQGTEVGLRTRLGIGTKPWRGLSIFAEMEANLPVDEDAYWNLVDANPKNKAPIADPAYVQLNRAFARYQNPELWGADVVGGRQRIILDDARFIGNVGWRQNEQTFDAARGSTSLGVESLKLDYAYLWSIKRIFANQGATAATRDWTSSSHLIHAAFDRFPLATASVFAYLLDFDQAPANSTNSYGFRLHGNKKLDGKWLLGYVASFTWQTDAGNSSLDYAAPYGWLSISAGHADWATLELGYEHLGSDSGNAQFRTPLATAHKFNGFADAFLDNGGSDGLQDLMLTLAPKLPWKLGGKLVYHRFWSAQGGRNAGHELDFVVKRPIGRFFSVLLKAAFFDGQGSGATTSGRTDRYRLTFDVSFKY